MIRVDIRAVVAALGAGVAVLVALHALVFFVGLPDALPGANTLRGFVDVGAENSFPTWWSSMLLLAAALVAAGLWGAYQGASLPHARGWLVLAAFLALLSVDEVASVHERMNFPTRTLLGTDGLLFQAWVFPALALVLGVVLAMGRLLRSLPPPTLARLGLAAAVYFGGAFGIELVGGPLRNAFGSESRIYEATVLLEEGCEMFGVVLLLSALLQRLAAECSGVRIALLASGASAAARAGGGAASEVASETASEVAGEAGAAGSAAALGGRSRSG